MNYLRPLKHRDSAYGFHSRHGWLCVYSAFLLSCVYVEALRRADPLSKEYYRLVTRPICELGTFQIQVCSAAAIPKKQCWGNLKIVEYFYWNVRLRSKVLLSISSTRAAPSDSYTAECLHVQLEADIRHSTWLFCPAPLHTHVQTHTHTHTHTYIHTYIYIYIYIRSFLLTSPLNRIPQPTEREVIGWSKCISVVF
jgi:hypothetical protein